MNLIFYFATAILSTMLELTVQKRDVKQKPATLREGGVLPAVFYGPKEESMPIAVDMKVFEKVWKEAGETTVVNLKGVGEDKEALIYNVVKHPTSDVLEHVDFYVFERGKKIEVQVPIAFIGEAPAEKEGHVIVKALHEIEIRVRPAEIPHQFEVDISHMSDVSDSITVADIAIPESAELITDAEETIIIVKEAKEEQEPQEGLSAPLEESSEEAAKDSPAEEERSEDEKSE